MPRRDPHARDRTPSAPRSATDGVPAPGGVPRVVRRVAAALALGAAFLAAACAAARPHVPDPDAPPRFDSVVVRARPETPADVAAAMAEARRLAGLGRRGDAFAALEPSLRGRPRALEAERLLQDLLGGTRSDAWIKRRAEEDHDRHPDDADAAYLRGRIEAARGFQAELFERALALDPGHPYARIGRALALERAGDAEGAVREIWRVAAETPWSAVPWLQLGALALARGAPDAAERFLLEAAARAPEDARPWAALAAAHDEREAASAAGRAAVEALRRAPGDPASLWPLVRVVERSGDATVLADALAAVEPARTHGGDPGAVEAFRGRVLVALGRPGDAEAALRAALRHGTAPGDVAVPLRRALVAQGRVAEAVEGWLGDLPFDPVAAGDERAPAWRELREAAAADDATAGGALRVAAALESVGWLHEAADVLDAAASRWPADADVASGREALGRFRGFLEAFARRAREARRAERRGDETDLDDLLGGLARISREHLGTDASEGLVWHGFPPVGSFAETADAAGPARDVFTRRGLLLLVGARTGGGAEILAGRLVSRRTGVRAECVGTAVEYDEHWIETEGLPEGLAGRRGGLAGITLGRFVLLQSDVVRAGPPREDPGLPFLARAATHDATIRTLDTPSDVARRIERSLAARGTLERDAADAVVRHERVHVLDAARLLPPWRHPFASLGFAIGHGFSARAMEETLEARAAVGALVDAAEPRAALAALLAFLPAEAGDTPHVAGYRGAIHDAVDLLLSDPAAFPSVDPRWNVVQQMDRLTSDEVRELGRRLAARRGVP